MNLTFEAAWVVIMAEVLAVLIVAVTGWWLYQRSRKNQTLAEIDRFVAQVIDNEALKTEPLEHVLNQAEQIDWELVEQTVQKVSAAERAVFQQVIEFYLQQNPKYLKKIEQKITGISEPYCKLLEHVLKNRPNSTVDDAPPKPTQSIEQINYQLTQQLRHALQTIEEVNQEYTRVFNGRQTALELENSAKRMLQLFREAEQHLKDIQYGKIEETP